jgi:hypothetical protein
MTHSQKPRKHYFTKKWQAEVTVSCVPCPPEHVAQYWAGMRLLASLIRPELEAIRNVPCPPPQPIKESPAVIEFKELARSAISTSELGD